MNTPDPITVEVVKNALTSIADEMALIIMRCSYSPILRDTLDYSTALCDAKGRVIAQGLTIPLHLASFPAAMKKMLSLYADNILEGDIFIANDPYLAGGMHLPDIYIIKPIFVDARLQGFGVALAHQSDIGGIAAGGTSVESKEIFQEGLRIPLLKLYERGKLNECVLQLIQANTRLPSSVLGDLRSQMSAVEHAHREMFKLVRKYGAAELDAIIDELHDYAERLMRQEIAHLPDGVYEFDEFFDGLGAEPEPLRLHARVVIAGDSIEVDWKGSSAQVKGAINCPIPYTAAAVFAAIRCITDPLIPNCEGYMRAIKVTAPEGTIVNPSFPAACAARGVIGLRALDCMFGALARAIPDRIPAATDGGPVILTIAGWREKKRHVFADCLLGSWGASNTADGSEGVSTPGVNLTNYPIEMAETEYPIEIQEYTLVADSGGAGKQRGGLAIKKSYKVLMDDAVLTVRSDRRDHPPWGLEGGRAGAPSWNIVNEHGDPRVLPQNPMEQVPLAYGDVFTHIGASGGGFGEPWERDLALVQADAAAHKISHKHAKDVYGVVLTDDGQCDRTATEQLRVKLRAAIGSN